ncbi:chaoptin isoform X2 [Daktulosphaira vitifoliae]|nr:chaoptin isoform X2 [Daktulosphaira vitifoliae]XP_050544186.1 chaoptin isoform X2 [Daktulosphaira vitifoliae]
MTFIHMGYALMMFTFLLMIWFSSIKAENFLQDKQPCTFNPLCSCTKSYDSLGVVHCDDIYFPRIPLAINRSRLSTLHLRNNDLDEIEPYFLVNTGLYKITIQDNPLTDLHEESLYGLEHSLWELELVNTRLNTVPSRAIRILQKLKILNLSGNQISEIKTGDWNGLDNSLKILKLTDNAITFIGPRAFDGLMSLEVLDLSGNMISEIHVNAFQSGPLKLYRLNLADNLLKFIPYVHLSSSEMKFLKYLDVSYNLIESTRGPSVTMASKGGRRKFFLDELHLEYNHIKILEYQSLQNFEAINKTYFDGNPITHIQDGAFQSTKIRELYIVDCEIYNVSLDAFKGLETCLQTLDVSHNNITEFPVRKLQQNFNMLLKLGLKDNKMKNLYLVSKDTSDKIVKSDEKKSPNDRFKSHNDDKKLIFKNTDENKDFLSLQDFDFSGWKNGPLQMNTINGFKYVRRLSLSRLYTSSLTSDMFQNFTIDMDELQITGSELKAIKAHAFKHIHGLKYLDLSDNTINLLESEAFKEVGHSLQYLKMSHAFSPSFKPFPGDAFRYLSNLKYLDLSNNHLQQLRESTFHAQINLRTLNLQDCMIDSLPIGTFQSEINGFLEELYLSSNSLKKIQENTFDSLPSLSKIHLDENRITRIEKHAFANLESLRWLILRGNIIEKLFSEAFQNLPNLQELDLAYNSIQNMDFSFLDQVGMLSYFRLNVSHNQMSKLHVNSNFSKKESFIQSNIRVLDISYNNIKDIEDRYFSPMESSLSHLHMSYNIISQVSRNIFGNLYNLIWLDLGHNRIVEIGFDTFKSSKKLQVILMNHNRLHDVPNDLFKGFSELRIVDFSYNKIRVLPDMFFSENSLEVLKLAHNELSRMPVLSFAVHSAAVICDMDLSYNMITALPVFEMFSRFKSLKKLNLAGNRLIRLEDSNFAALSHLRYLDLSSNNDLVFENKGRTFLGLDQTLKYLRLKNISLINIPELPLPSLVHLDLSRNQIASISSEKASNLSSLQHLDLSNNELIGFPPIVMSLPQLNSLNLANNHIYDINNNSLTMGVQKLITLDISYLPLMSFETGALNKMISLRTLVISTFVAVKDFNVASCIGDIHTIRNLNLKVDKVSRIGKEFNGLLPYKLRNITISGKALHLLSSDTLLQGMQYPSLSLTIYNTSLESISADFFHNMGTVRNISLDIRNNSLKSFGNPSTNNLPKQHRETFLTALKVSGNPWVCDCKIGWMEVWHRKKRQYLCTDELPSSTNRLREIDYYSMSKSNCLINDEDLEVAMCADRKKSLADAFKSDIECGWGAAGTCRAHLIVIVIALVLYAMANN